MKKICARQYDTRCGLWKTHTDPDTAGGITELSRPDFSKTLVLV